MSTIKEIESAISKLPREDLRALRKWFADFDAEQFEDDVSGGRLDNLVDKAIKDFQEGRCTDL